MKHPSSIDLEAFACGEPNARAGEHVASCDACTSHVERLRGLFAAGPSQAKARDAVTRIAQRLEVAPGHEPTLPRERAGEPTPARLRARRAWLWRGASVAAPLAAAAAVTLLLRSGGTTTDPLPGAPVRSVATSGEPNATSEPGTTEPGTTFKGNIQIAVVRERGAAQSRFASTVKVKPGDRLRVEVALDREEAILAAVLGDDGSWLELMTERIREPGTHFSERSARVDETPLRGTILVGSPAAMALAKRTRSSAGVSALRIEWENTP